MKIQKTKVDMCKALHLGSNAFKLLNIMYYQNVDGNETTLRSALGVGRDTYKKALSELKDSGYIEIVQTGKGYKYLLGEKKIAEHDKKYEVKALIDNMVESRMMIERRELTAEEKQETIRDAMEIYNNKALEKELKKMKEVQI